MIVIHAIWDNYTNNKLQLWAESSSPTSSAVRRAKKQAEQQQSQQHPFSLQREPLREAISELAGNLLAKSAGTGSLRLLLPSTGSGPLSSPELILEKEFAELKATGFSSWNIDTLALDPDNALDFLLSLPNYAPHGVAFGSSLHFWKDAAAFAFELIARQSYVPTLEEIQQNGVSIYRAAWQVVIAEEDGERVSLLAKAMPPVCWAFLPSSEMKPSVLQNVLLTFLNQTLDAFVRKSLSSTALLPTRPNHSKRSSKVSLAEQWLQALASDEPTLVATPEELQRFSVTLHNWIDQIRPMETGAAFRTCFRLYEPDEPDEPGEDNEKDSDWRISFYLQANDDRSLLVPADKVWKERSSTLTFLKRKFENPQERLLADLGKATRLFPALEESLRAARPEELKLNTEQAYTFLRESAPLLEQSGFGVLVPPWWQKPTARLGVKLKIQSQADANTSSELLGLRSIVAYNWTIAVGDTDLSMEEFESLVNLKVPLIKIRGQWVELRPEEIEAAIAFFKKKHSNGYMSLGEALRIGLGQEASELGLPINDIEGDGWIKELLDKLIGNNKIATIKTPSTFQGKLRPYQLKGVSWLAFLAQFGFGACLADDMGLGKTAELIALLLHTHSTQQGVLQAKPALVICPMSI
ncbi:MAG: SNF2-related protein, partial [Chloroflexota bacterium]|nr:SNF2-related protein [Chloroflexota bacterium]